MNNWLERTEQLIGADAINRLQRCRIAVFGIGGVGGYAAEALARSGIGHIHLVDADIVTTSNINRQIIALTTTVGQKKVDVLKQRLFQINPSITVTTNGIFFDEKNEHQIDFLSYHYVIDAIDSFSSKILLIERCTQQEVPIISSMGAGNKLHPEYFEIEDIYRTSVCPMARKIRHELKKRKISSLKVVYSKEHPIKHHNNTPGSISFVPSAVGLIIAGEVVRNCIQNESEPNE